MKTQLTKEILLSRGCSPKFVKSAVAALARLNARSTVALSATPERFTSLEEKTYTALRGAGISDKGARAILASQD